MPKDNDDKLRGLIDLIFLVTTMRRCTDIQIIFGLIEPKRLFRSIKKVCQLNGNLNVQQL